MNYNQLNFYHASPYYKQDFLPDRAWYNRQPRSYPAQMPSGKDFLPANGRKHYQGKLNRSQIVDQGVLKSPERYPFENRIALQKTYMRSLNTIDIQGASHNTKVNQSIKNKHKANEFLTQEHKIPQKTTQITEQDRRRQIAQQQYKYHKERQYNLNNQRNNKGHSLNHNNVSNPEIHQKSPLKTNLTQEYKRFIMQNSSNKFHKDKPLPREQPQKPIPYSVSPQRNQYQHNQYKHNEYQHQRTEHPSYQQQRIEHPQYQQQQRTEHAYDQYKPQESYQHRLQKINENPGNAVPPIDNSKQLKRDHSQPTKQMRYNSKYQNDFNPDRDSQAYKKILKFQEMNRLLIKNPKVIRSTNPTNLSLSFAGKSIVNT